MINPNIAPVDLCNDSFGNPFLPWPTDGMLANAMQIGRNLSIPTISSIITSYFGSFAPCIPPAPVALVCTGITSIPGSTCSGTVTIFASQVNISVPAAFTNGSFLITNSLTVTSTINLVNSSITVNGELTIVNANVVLVVGNNSQVDVGACVDIKNSSLLVTLSPSTSQIPTNNFTLFNSSCIMGSFSTVTIPECYSLQKGLSSLYLISNGCGTTTLSIGGIAGICIGAVAFVAIVIVVVLCNISQMRQKILPFRDRKSISIRTQNNGS